MDNSGQHNLSIALRHILQQFMDSTNSHGLNNTDMTLPHDGYIQRLSWHFECDKCQYRAFYSHDMENHKSLCSVYDENSFSDSKLFNEHKPFVKKRKLGVPRRTPATTIVPPQPLDDSDQDSQAFSSPAIQQPDYISSPVTIPSSQDKEPAVTTTAGGSTMGASQSVSSPLSLEAASVEFDAPLASPEYEGASIADIEQSADKALDFDSLPSKDTPTVTASVHEPSAMSQSEAPDPYDPDILEIKVEVDERDSEESAPPPLSSLPTTNSSTDALFSAGIPDNSVECMMAMFGTSTSQSTPNNPTTASLPSNLTPASLPNPPSLHSSTNPPTLHSHSTPPMLHTPSQRPSMFLTNRPITHTPGSRPMLHSSQHGTPFSTAYNMPNKVYRKPHPLPHLSMGNFSQVRTPVLRPHGPSTSSMSASSLQPSGIKVVDCESLDCGDFGALSDEEFRNIPVVKRLMAYHEQVVSSRQLQQLKYCHTAERTRQLLFRAAQEDISNDETLKMTTSQLAKKILICPGKYTSSRQIRMSYSYSRRPHPLLVEQAFVELEMNKLGKHYANLGFVKSSNPDVDKLAKYGVSFSQYINKYNMKFDTNTKVPYGLTVRACQQLDALIDVS